MTDWGWEAYLVRPKAVKLRQFNLSLIGRRNVSEVE